jgi:hypothetical protein
MTAKIIGDSNVREKTSHPNSSFGDKRNGITITTTHTIT